MKLILVRHGQTIYNVEKLINDDPSKIIKLSSLGLEQVKEVAEKLKNENIDLIFVSELNRTKDTSKIINKSHNAPVIIDRRLNDRKTGFEGLYVSKFHEYVKKDMFNIKPPNGESFQEEKERIRSFLEELKNKRGKTVLIVGHKEPLQLLIGLIKKESDEKLYSRDIKNAQLFEIDF